VKPNIMYCSVICTEVDENGLHLCAGDSGLSLKALRVCLIISTGLIIAQQINKSLINGKGKKCEEMLFRRWKIENIPLDTSRRNLYGQLLHRLCARIHTR